MSGGQQQGGGGIIIQSKTVHTHTKGGKTLLIANGTDASASFTDEQLDGFVAERCGDNDSATMFWLGE